MERMAMHTAWADDDIEVLKRLWAEGVTAEAIAARLGGLTRSAVLGKIFRLRLGPAPGGEAPKAEMRGKSLFDLTNSCCRWPYRRPGTGKYFFCGVEEADLEQGKPYCDRHMKRAYLIPPNAAARPLRAHVRAA